jgi:dTDP-4-dehydrorhamnose 3,5-epimerase
MPFQFQRLGLPEVICIRAQSFADNRGFFLETYKHSAFSASGIPDRFVQDNHSHSRRGVLRGLHYQKEPMAQAKLVMVVRGEVFDVAVDIRKGSPTYGHWLGMTLSADEFCMLYIPAGFAHGFCVLSEKADLLYKVTDEYAPDLERGIVWNDPEIGIQWPITNPSLSDRDAQLPPLKQADNNLVYRARQAE